MLFSSWLSFALNRLRLIETHSYMLMSVRLARVRCTDASRQDAAHPNTDCCLCMVMPMFKGGIVHGRCYNASLQLATVSYPISHAKFCSLLPEMDPLSSTMFAPSGQITLRLRARKNVGDSLHLAAESCFDLLHFSFSGSVLKIL